MEDPSHQQEEARCAKNVEAPEMAAKPTTVNDPANADTYVTVGDARTGKCHLLPPRLTISALHFFLSNLTVMVTDPLPM